MSPWSPRDADVARINDALALMGQGWFARRDGEGRPLLFAHLVEPDSPLTVAASGADLADALAAVDTEVPGLVLISQTCDIARDCKTHPFIQLCPLVQLLPNDLTLAKRSPMYGVLPALGDESLVADLRRIMTVEKALIASWPFTAGVQDDFEVRDFGRSIARRFGRFAFPDDFVAHVKRFQERVRKQHGKGSPEGLALQSLREIRVRATPWWNHASPLVHIWLIRGPTSAEPIGIDWQKLISGWQALLVPTGLFRNTTFLVTTLDTLTGRDYAESDPLDLDYLSGP